ncbi:MAG: DNA polymerase III subunit gamma/tau [Granulosicoccus sp.]
MSYKVLARKWRPHHFRDMLGQEPVLRALVNALDSNRLHHAYLFTGMRGVGKTTIARIFAKCLNCETNGVSSDPCGTCSACQDIDAGRFFDLIEVDAASRTKVESTRELLENVPYAPASGRYKVYLIDEVHMFSTHSFNALLKTLEEPPEHVKFLLATTDPQKVPATVLSRCLQFNLKRMSPGVLTDYLAKILTEEKIEHEIPALDLIARASEGSVRDSLSLVEQAAASGEGAVRATEVESMLGRASVERLLALIETLAAGDMPALFSQVEELAQYAPEFSELLGEILSLLHRVAMLRTVPGSVSEATPGYSRLASLAKELDPDVVQLFYQIGLHARRDMPFAPDTREAFDMTLLRMHAFKPQGGFGGQNPVGSTTSGSAGAKTQPDKEPAASAKPAAAATVAQEAEKPAGLEVRGSVSAGGSMRAAALAAARGEPLPEDVVAQLETLNGNTAAAAATANAPESPSAAPSSPEPAKASASSTPVAAAPVPVTPVPVTPVPSQAAPMQAAPEPASTQVENTATTPPVQASSIDKSQIKAADWPQIVTELDVAGMPLQLANNCIWAGITDNRVLLHLEDSAEHLNTERFVERLRSALTTWFGRDIEVNIDQVEQSLETPAKIAQKQADDDMAAAHDSIKLDPIVRQLIEQVDGAVDEASIRPLNRPPANS